MIEWDKNNAFSPADDGEFINSGTLLAALPGMVYCGPYDAQRTLNFVSEGSLDLTGFRAAELVNLQDRSFIDLVHHDDRAEMLQEIATAVAEKRPYRCVYRLLRANGEERWVLDRGQVRQFDDLGEVLVGYIFDHTDRMQTWSIQEKQLAVMAERNRLARELHDSISQALYSVTLFAEAGRNFAQLGEHNRAANYFADILETGQQAIKEMRLLVHKLRPSRLAEDGFVHALQHRLNAVEGRAGVKHHLIVGGLLNLPADAEEALYHIVQEALNNSLKHAAATDVVVTIEQPVVGHVRVTIQDNGCGFDLDTAVMAGGLGLTSMLERAAMIQGDLSIQSTVGHGTTILVRWPRE